jgi:hypothetical protein
MAEATLDTSTDQPDPAELAALRDAARQIDRAHMQQIGGLHFAMVMGAITMWGAAVVWAQSTGWALAEFAAVANALVLAYILSSTIHEWGHFTGARLSGSVSPVFEAPKRHFFMFNFPIDQNDTRQFLWMSWGGILAPWVAVLLALIFVPLALTSGAVLVATLISRAVAVSAFEVPVARGTAVSGDPGGELGKATKGGGLPWSRKVGYAAGAASFVLIWIAT